MVNVELSGQAANDDSGRFIRSAGLSCLTRSSNHTNGTDQRNQTNQIAATRRETVAGVVLLPEIQNVPVYSSGERRRKRSRNDSRLAFLLSLCPIRLP